MSGRIFDHNVPVSAEAAVIIQNDIIHKLKEHFPEHEVIPIGSVGRRESTYMHNDIDVAVEALNVDELYDMVSEVFDDAVMKESLYVVSIPYKYEEGKTIQVDFILMRNTEWTKFRYWCPDYSKGESRYKVGPKIMLTNMLLNHAVDIMYYEVPEGWNAIFDYRPDGLYRTIYKFNGSIKTEFLSDDPTDIPYMLFGEKGTMSMFNSVETIWDAIHSEHYRYKDHVKQIERNWFINCYKKGWESIRPEDFNLEHWTVEEINIILEKYKRLHTINRILNPDEKNV